MEHYGWRTNRLLVLLQPETYYACCYFWQDDTDQFLCYYVNFQLPFWRSNIGFDTFDLELDIVIEPTYEWCWKDVDDYQKGIKRGILRKEWIQEIDAVKPEIFDKLKNHQYPFDGSWLDWMPDPTWSSPRLPDNWKVV
jgi:protein associated with RNAse G/E